MAGAGKRSGALVVLASAVLASAVVVNTFAPAAAGETGAPPEPGSTFRGSNRRASVDFVVSGPDEDGNAQLLAEVTVRCNAEDRSSIEGEPMTGPIEADGTFDIEAELYGDFDGAAYDGPVRLRGTFTDTGLDVTIQYELVETDDEDKVLDECEVGPVPLKVNSETGDGRDHGIGRVEGVIPILKRSDPHKFGVVATSTTHVFVAVSKGESEGGGEPVGKVTTVLVRIDPQTNGIAEQRTVDGDFSGLVAVDDRLFGIAPSTGAVVPIDPVTLQTGVPIQVAANILPGAVAVGGSLWVSVPVTKEIVRIAPDTGEITGRVALEGAAASLAAGPAGLYAVTQGPAPEPQYSVPRSERTYRIDTLVRIDPATASVVASSAPSPLLDLVVADATGVFLSNEDPRGGFGLARLDPVTLSVTLTTDELGLLVAAPPGVWGTTFDERDDRFQLVALDSNLSVVTKGVDIGGENSEVASGLGAIWFYDAGLHAVYRIATG